MKESIVLDPLHHFKRTRPGMIHSDRGSQYHSYAFQDYLENHPITHSVSEPLTPVDNAVIESFHRSIKRELTTQKKQHNG